MFLQEPHFAVGEKYQWVLTRALVYYSCHLGCRITVPEGFETDLASIPRVFHRLLPVNDKHRLAAVVHDYLYSLKGQLPHKNITRKQADDAFLEAMQVLGVPSWKRHLMHRAVRLGGWTYWKE